MATPGVTSAKKAFRPPPSLLIKRPKSQANPKRHRFVKHSVKAKAARTMTGKNVVISEKELDAIPEGGVTSCFMKESLEEENLRNPSKPFQVFYRATFPMVQSQALLMHNLDKLVGVFIEHITRPDVLEANTPFQKRKAEALAIPSILRLVSVLARDISPNSLCDYIEPLMDACLKRLDPTNVDVTTLAFQAIGKLFERCGSAILEKDPSLSLQTKRYPNLLSHTSEMVRNLAAETFAFLIRQQVPVERKKHVWSILKAPSGTYSRGVATLLLFVVKGVQNRFHSNMPKVFGSALRGQAKNKDKSKSIDEVKANLFAWSESLRLWSRGVDDESVFEVFCECLESCEEDLSDAVFVYSLVEPWITEQSLRWRRESEKDPISQEIQDRFESVLKSQLQRLASSPSSMDHDEIENGILSFAVDLWKFVSLADEGDEHDKEAHDESCFGEILSTYLAQISHSRASKSDRIYLKALGTLDFLSQFVKYLLLHVTSENSLKVWTEISRMSHGCFGESVEAWHHYLDDDTVVRGTFSNQTGRLSEKFVVQYANSLMESALVLLDAPIVDGKKLEEALEFLSALEPQGKESGEQKPSKKQGKVTTGESRVELALRKFIVRESISTKAFGIAVKAALRYCLAGTPGPVPSWLQVTLVSRLENLSFASSDALDALQEMIPSCSIESLRSNASLVSVLTQSLASLDVSLRRSSCRNLSSLFPSLETLPILQRLHDLDATYESERSRQITADALSLVFLKRLDKQEVGIALHGILGLYHVRFQPAWAVASSLLEKLAKQHADLMWKLGLFDFFKHFAAFKPVEQNRVSTSPEQVFISFMTALVNCGMEASNSSASSLLKLLRRENKQWIYLFFRFMRDEYYPSRSPEDLMLQTVTKEELALGGPEDQPIAMVAPTTESSETEEAEDEDESDQDEDSGLELNRLHPSGTTVRKKLLLWLQLLGSVSSLAHRDLMYVDSLEQVWMRLLLSETFALSATQCLINVHKDQLGQYRVPLETLAGMKTEGFRDALADLSDALMESHAKDQVSGSLLVEVASRVLFGKLTQRPGRRERFSPAQRRRAIFSAFASLGEGDCERSLRPLFTLMLRPFRALSSSAESSVLERYSGAAEGFLSLLKEAIKVLGKRMLPFVGEVMSALATLVKESCFGTSVQLLAIVDDEDDDAKSTMTTKTTLVKGSVQTRVRTESLARIAECIVAFVPEFDFTTCFAETLGPALERLSSFKPAANEPPSVLLRLVSACVSGPSSAVRQAFFKYSGESFETFLERIEASTNDLVVKTVFSAIEAILEQNDGELLLPYVGSFLTHISKRKTLRNPKELEILGRVARGLVPMMIARQQQDSIVTNQDLSKKRKQMDVGGDAALSQVYQVCLDLLLLLVDFVLRRPKRANEEDDSRVLTFDTMTALAENLPKDRLVLVRSKLFLPLSTLFGPWAQGHEVKAKPAREALVRLFVSINVSDSVDTTETEWENESLPKLNSWLQTRIDRDCDFEARLERYHACVARVEAKSAEKANTTNHLSPVLINQALNDMQHSDFALRTVAQTFMLTCIRSIVSLDAVRDENLIAVLSLGLRTGIKLSKDMSYRGGYLLALRDVVKMVNTVPVKDSPNPNKSQMDEVKEANETSGDEHDGLDVGEAKGEHDESEEAEEIVETNVIEVEQDKAVRTRLHGDLQVVMDDSNTDVDFFLSASHVQTSRRAKVMSRVAGQINRGEVKFSEDTVRFILVPIALHGVFLESSSKSETGTGIALAGSCASLLVTFRFFTGFLQSVLKKLSRAETRLQERVLLRCGCAILDGFPLHGDKAMLEELKRRFYNRFSRLLILQKNKEADEELNESVALSLVKLARDSEEALDNVILQVCGQLKRRKQSARDSARAALKKISKFLGVEYFPTIFGHLKSTVREGGYQVHVLAYTLYILVDGLKEEVLGMPTQTTTSDLFTEDPTESREDNDEDDQDNGNDEELASKAKQEDLDEDLEGIEPAKSVHKYDEFRRTALDGILNDIVEVIEEHMFGEHAPTSENGYKAKVHLREMRAGKTVDTLESLAACIAFLPADSVHKLTRPFLDRLASNAAMLDPKVLNKCREGLYRIRRGLLRNSDVRPEHLLVYVQSTVHAWVEARETKEKQGEQFSGSAKSWLLRRAEDDEDTGGQLKGKAYASRLLYQPGTQLTGKSAERMKKLKLLESGGKLGGDAANAEHLYVEFVLDLLNNKFFSKNKIEGALPKWVQHYEMIIPLIRMLVWDVIMKDASSKRTIVVSLLMCHRMLQDQEQLPENAKRFPSELIRPLVTRSLKFVKQNSISSAVVAADVARASMDLLGTLLERDPNEKIFSQDDVKLLIRMARLDLDDPNRLQGALKLLKSVFDRKMLLPEMYDVALRLTELMFQAGKERDRSKCAEVVSRFLLDYPLEEKRIRQQIDLVIKNLDFPFEDGRLAGLNMLKICIERFPKELVDESAEFFFLPLVMRIVNEDSPAVKEKATKVAIVLLQKLQEKKFQNVSELSLSWFTRPASLPAACHACGVLLECGKVPSRSQLMGTIAEKLVETILDQLNNGSVTEWEILYNALTSFEPLLRRDQTFLSQIHSSLNRLLVHGHAWIRLVAGRILSIQLRMVLEEISPAVTPSGGVSKKAKTKIEKSGLGSFSGFDVLLALVDQLDSDSLSDELAQQVTSNFYDLIKVAKAKPQLFYSSEVETAKNPVSWMVKRLSVVASRPESDRLDLKNRRRRAVFNVFLAVCADGEDTAYLAKDDVEAYRSMVKATMVIHVPDPKAFDPLKELCDQVLDAVKSVIGAERFVLTVNDIRNVKQERKREKRKVLALSKVLPMAETEFFPKRQKL